MYSAMLQIVFSYKFIHFTAINTGFATAYLKENRVQCKLHTINEFHDIALHSSQTNLESFFTIEFSKEELKTL